MDETKLLKIFSKNMNIKTLNQIAQETGVSRYMMDKVYNHYKCYGKPSGVRIESSNINPHSNNASFHEIVSAILKDKSSYPSSTNVDRESIPASSIFKFLKA